MESEFFEYVLLHPTHLLHIGPDDAVFPQTGAAGSRSELPRMFHNIVDNFCIEH